eukprot:g3505.t1
MYYTRTFDTILVVLIVAISTRLVVCRIGTTKLQIHRRHLLQDLNSIVNPENDVEHPHVAYPMNVGLNWYSANYIPQKNGGKSLVPMDDGIDIAKTSKSKGKTEDGYRIDHIDAPHAPNNDAFQVGTDKDYMALKGSGGQAAPAAANDGKGDFSEEAKLINGGHEIDPPGVHGQE